MIPNDELKCDACGMTYMEFLKTGIFGCPNCYIVFKTKTVEYIKNKIEEKQLQKTKTVLKANETFNTRRKYKKSDLHRRISEIEELLEMCEKNNDTAKKEELKKELKKLKDLEAIKEWNTKHRYRFE